MTYEYDLHESKEAGGAEGKAEGMTEKPAKWREGYVMMVYLWKSFPVIRGFPSKKSRRSNQGYFKPI